MADKQDSNLTGLAIAEEASLGNLPSPESNTEWLTMEPSGYPSFGGNVTKESRETINPTRKIRKGGTVGVDAAGGFSHDLVMRWLLRVMRGFFFTDGDEASTTDPLDISAKLTCTGVTTVDDTYALSGSLATSVQVDNLVVADGFTEAGNNGVKTVTTASSAAVAVSENLTDEASPPTAARVRVCGHQFASGELVATVAGNYLLVTSSHVLPFTGMPIVVGDVIFLGGDTSGAGGNQFTTLGTGYARVVSISSTVLTLQDFTGTVAADDGVGETIQIFFAGVGFRDEPLAANIVRRSYQLERTLGDDGVGTQAEYITGAIANEMKFNLPEESKISCEFGFLGLDRETVTGTAGIKAGTRHSVEAEEFVNTSTDVFASRLIAADQSNLIGYIADTDFAINNGVKPNKAVGVIGAFDFSSGDFKVTGSVNAYFSAVAVMQAVRDNDSVSMQIITAKDNEGFAVSMPLVTLSGGEASIDSGEPIMLPLDFEAAAGTDDLTCIVNYFPYLPTIAMPT